MKKDQVIFDLIEKEHQRQLKGMELIASENFVSDEVMQAMGSCLTNKYAEGLPGKRYYGGCGVVDEVENLAIERVKKLFGAEFANVQPHSGAQANAAVLLTVLNPGDTFLGLNLAHGGHLSHGSNVNTSGILYHAVGYNLNKETGRVDYDEMEQLALEHKPKLIIGGGSAYSREWDYKRMREIADKVGAILMIDMAHPAGLIAAGLLDNRRFTMYPGLDPYLDGRIPTGNPAEIDGNIVTGKGPGASFAFAAALAMALGMDSEVARLYEQMFVKL